MKELIAAMVLLAIPTVASGQGVDISWNDCAGSGIESNNRNFLCTGTTNQNSNLVVQFKSPISLSSCVAVYADLVLIDGTAAGGPLPPYWHHESNGCQNPSGGIKGLTMSDNVFSLSGCINSGFADLWDGDGTGGFDAIVAYGPDNPTPGQARLLLGDTRFSGGVPVDAFVNYYAFHLTFNNRHRADCAGCTDKVAVMLREITLQSDDGTPDLHLRGPDKFTNCVLVNGASVSLCNELVSVQDRDLSSTSPRVTGFPNPFRDRVGLVFALAAARLLRVEVLDLSGHRVWSSPLRHYSAGAQSVAWDGRGSDGSEQHPGMYFVRVSGPGFEARGRVALLK